MKQAIFYLLQHNQSVGMLSAHEALVCAITSEHWRDSKRLLIACESKEQARRLDEALWCHDPHAFIPHNLVGEGPILGAPIELCWPGQSGNLRRDLLIALQPQFIDFAATFHQVIDFVPYEDTLKHLARDRYRAYRKVSFHLITATPPAHLTIT